jgi:hypothetical protein
VTPWAKVRKEREKRNRKIRNRKIRNKEVGDFCREVLINDAQLPYSLFFCSLFFISLSYSLFPPYFCGSSFSLKLKQLNMSVHHDEETKVQPDGMGGGLKLLLPVLLLCLIAAAVFYLTKGDGEGSHNEHGTTDSTEKHEGLYTTTAPMPAKDTTATLHKDSATTAVPAHADTAKVAADTTRKK